MLHQHYEYNKSQMNRRIDLDIAKGLGIIMVVWAHASGPLTSYIYQFHMPLFFFISGMLFKDPSNLKMYYIRKMKSLLIPFWICNYILLLPFWILYYWKDWSLLVLGNPVMGKAIPAVMITQEKVSLIKNSHC